MEAYPVQNSDRRERFAEVMAGLSDYSPEQLDGELIDLYATHVALKGEVIQGGAQGFLEELRLRVKN